MHQCFTVTLDNLKLTCSGQMRNLQNQLAEKDRVIASQQHDLKIKNEGLKTMVAMTRGQKRGNLGKNSVRKSIVKNDPLRLKILAVIKTKLVQRTMLLQEPWHVYSQKPTTFCQVFLGMLGFKDVNGDAINIPSYFSNEEHLWTVVRVHVNDLGGAARTALRLRVRTLWISE